MEWLALSSLLQMFVGLGLLNVWLVRGRSITAYRAAMLAMSAAIVALH